MNVYFPFWHQSFFAWILKHRYATSSSWRRLVCLHCIFFLLILFVLRESLRRDLCFDEDWFAYILTIYFMNLYTDIYVLTKIVFLIFFVMMIYVNLDTEIFVLLRIGLLIFGIFPFDNLHTEICTIIVLRRIGSLIFGVFSLDDIYFVLIFTQRYMVWYFADIWYFSFW